MIRSETQLQVLSGRPALGGYWVVAGEYLLSMYFAPAAATALVWRYLIVAPTLAADPFSRQIAAFANQQPAVFLALVFLGIAAIIGYWRNHWQWSRRVRLAFVHPQVNQPHDTEAIRAIAPAFKSKPFAFNRFAAILGRCRDHATTALVVVAAGAIALLFRQYLWQTYAVRGSSMLPTFQHGDRIAAQRAITHTEPIRLRRGDVVIFRPSEHEVASPQDRIIKRVIGLPGDRITMRGAVPVINGWAVPSCDAGIYATLSEGRIVYGHLMVEFLDDSWHLALYSFATRPFTEEYEVAEGEVFVLGDNRADSIDSRTWDDGYGAGVSTDAIDGFAERFLLSTRRDGTADFTSVLKRPSATIVVEGIDTTTLNAGIERCLLEKPKETRPPEPARPGQSIARVAGS